MSIELDNTVIETRNKQIKELNLLLKDKEPIDVTKDIVLLRKVIKLTSEIIDPRLKPDLYESNPKKWHELIQFRSELDQLKELLKLKKGTDLYPQYMGNITSSYTGNHAKIVLWYIKNNKPVSIRLRSLGLKEFKEGWAYSKHGGNYSFTFDLVYNLGYLLHKDGYYFKENRDLE